MFTKIKEFLFGKDPVQSPVAAPYKVEAEVKAETPHKIEAVPAGTEASVAAAPVVEAIKIETPTVTVDGHGDVHEVATAPVKAKPKKAPAKKTTPKPRTPKTPAAK